MLLGTVMCAWQLFGIVRPGWNVSPCLTWSRLVPRPQAACMSVFTMRQCKSKRSKLHSLLFKFLFTCPEAEFTVFPTFRLSDQSICYITIALAFKRCRRSGLERVGQTQCRERFNKEYRPNSQMRRLFCSPLKLNKFRQLQQLVPLCYLLNYCDRSLYLCSPGLSLIFCHLHRTA